MYERSDDKIFRGKISVEDTDVVAPSSSSSDRTHKTINAAGVRTTEFPANRNDADPLRKSRTIPVSRTCTDYRKLMAMERDRISVYNIDSS